MTNAEKFKEIFKKFATEVWAFSEKDFLEWLNAEYKEPTTKNDLGVLDKIRAEIEIWHKYGINCSFIRLMNIEDILDEYKAEIEPQESEDKE